jgi:Gpi18-like mannosyltransferase
MDKPQGLISHFMLSAWANFDGVYYLLIAANGYTVNAGFFPLFPLLLSVVSSVFGQVLAFSPIQYLSSHLIVSFCFIVGLIMLYKLVKLDYKDNIAILTIVFMLLFPTSFFYASIYSESLFLLLSLLSFYFARTNHWFLASICAGLVTATRLVGIAIVPALIYEFVKKEKSLLKFKSLYLMLSPLGILGYMWFNFVKWGDPLFFIQAQGAFHNDRSVDSIVLIPQTIFRYLKILLTINPNIFEWWIALLEITTFIFVSLMLFIAWRKKVRLSYILFALLCFLIPVSTGTFSGLPRYALVLFPVFIALVLVKNKFVKIGYSIIGISLLLILLALFSKGYYIA